MQTRAKIRFVTVLCCSLAATRPLLAQESATFKIDASSFNAGGRPISGVVAESTSFRLSFDSIGDAVIDSGLTSPGFVLDAGLVGSFPPPGEVTNLRFSDTTTLVWDADPSVGDYALYQGLVASPFDAGYGICAQPPPAITVPSTTVASVPATGHALFYLMTARNRLSEESTKGFTSSGAQRANPAPCP